jgi:hypothetical protein
MKEVGKMNPVDIPRRGDKPNTQPQQQQQPQAALSSGRGADSALAVLKKRRVPLPGEQPHGTDGKSEQPQGGG